MPHAFKDLLTPETPQFILNIAVRYVLHHYSSQDIHHCKILEDNLLREFVYPQKGFVNCRKKIGVQLFFEWHAAAAGLTSKSEWSWMRANDPSAGSPTETLLRLLLPLSDKVH